MEWLENYKEGVYRPNIYFDKDKAICTIKGESFMENAAQFYKEFSLWIEQSCISSILKELRFEMEYFNSSSAKGFRVMMQKIHQIQDGGYALKVLWCFPEEDDNDMEMEGEDLIEDTEVEMELLQLA
ncbi:SiaC family regulatory phosphoprotein [Limibacter armeniacum]|uniref:SiaC family regulatory phosphoprotein n=1 Tax=Limibacter armeniacum TaxID=466084 RepID=UPI002FE5A8E1